MKRRGIRSAIVACLVGIAPGVRADVPLPLPDIDSDVVVYGGTSAGRGGGGPGGEDGQDRSCWSSRARTSAG